MTALDPHRGGDGHRLGYTLPALDGSVWLGLRASSLTVLALTLTFTVGAVLGGAPVPLAVAVLLLGGLPAVLPVAGRTVLGWLPAVIGHTLTRLTRATTWSGHTVTPDAAPDPRPRLDRVQLRVPAEYGRLDLLSLHTDHAGRTGPIAAVRNRRHPGEVTVVFEVTGTDRHALLDSHAQDTQLARWGSCLSALAADPRVHRLQWLTHTRPDTADHHTLRPAERGGLAAAGHVDVGLLEDYAQLTAAATAAALRHRHLLVLALHLDPSQDRTQDRRRDRDPGTAQVWRDALVEHVRDLAATLLTADLLPYPLSPAELGSTLRLLTDPTLSEEIIAPADPRRWTISSRHASWDHCRTDDTLHRSYAVTGWPRLTLPADWLAPILHTPPPDRTGRTLAVHARPVAPAHAARRARSVRAKAQLDAADRSRLGLSNGGASAADTLAVTDAVQLEAELVAGYRLANLTAFVTVSAPDPERLRVASSALRTLSATHRLDLRPLHGQHPHGLLATLPFGQLPGGRS